MLIIDSVEKAFNKRLSSDRFSAAIQISLKCVLYMQKSNQMKLYRYIFLWGLLLMSSAQANNVPEEIAEIENAFRSVPGIVEVGVGKHLFSTNEFQAYVGQIIEQNSQQKLPAGDE